MEKNKFEIITSEDGKQITVNDLGLRVSHTFELVEQVILGYKIWNIGKNMPDNYLPLCRLKCPGGYSIEPDTLRVIKCKGAQIILSAVHSGAYTVKEMEQYIKKNQGSPKGTWEHLMIKRIKKALPYMKQIRGLEG